MSKKTFCIRSLSQWVKHVFHLFFFGGRTVAISQSIVFFTEQDLLKSDWLCWHNMPPQQIVILGGLIYSSISLMYQRSLFVFFFSKSGFRNSCFNEKVIRTNSSWTLAHWLLILDCLFIVVKKTNPTGWQLGQWAIISISSEPTIASPTGRGLDIRNVLLTFSKCH